MKIQFQLLTVLVTVLLLITSLGCSKNEDESQEEPVLEADSSSQISSETAQDQSANKGNGLVPVDNPSLNEVIAFWDAGQKRL